MTLAKLKKIIAYELGYVLIGLELFGIGIGLALLVFLIAVLTGNGHL